MRNAALAPGGFWKGASQATAIADIQYIDTITLLWSPTSLRILTFDPWHQPGIVLNIAATYWTHSLFLFLWPWKSTDSCAVMKMVAIMKIVQQPPALMTTTFMFESLQYPSFPILWASANRLSHGYMPKGNKLLLLGWLADYLLIISLQCHIYPRVLNIPTTERKKNPKKKNKKNIKLIRSTVEYTNSPFENFNNNKQNSTSRMTTFGSYTMFLC